MLDSLLSQRIDLLEESQIGKLLALAGQDNFISFTAGVPARESYLVEPINQLLEDVLRKEGNTLFGYCSTDGDDQLRELVLARSHALFGVPQKGTTAIITTGSTQGIDLCGKAFVDSGDVVLLEEASYVDAKQSFALHGAYLEGVPCDDDGMDLSALEEKLKKGAKLIYVIPDFQNPTGRQWSLERRKAFMELVRQFDVLVLEDNPYGELYFEGAPMPSLASLDERDQVIYLGSSSKIFAPGLRIGWIIGPQNIMKTIHLLKEKADIHSTSLGQVIFREVLHKPFFESHMDSLRSLYKRKCEHMWQSITQEVPQVEVKKPKGGFFLWVQLQGPIDEEELLKRALQEKVLFIPGSAFLQIPTTDTFMRLAFSNVKKEDIEEGSKRLGTILRTL